MTALTDIKCVPCQGGEPVLTQKEIEKYLKEVHDNWQIEKNPDKIIGEFEFKDFMGAVGFVNKVASLAEEEGHHPNIYIHSYKKVRIELWTHKIGGLHENDFIMAAKIDQA
jgi:4a-hydroxytetrahydrobiopterin dehydratase